MLETLSNLQIYFLILINGLNGCHITICLNRKCDPDCLGGQGGRIYIGTGEDDLPTTVENLVNDQSEIFFFKTFRSWFFEYPKNQLLSAEQSHWSIANIALIGRWTSLQVERFHWLSSVRLCERLIGCSLKVEIQNLEFFQYDFMVFVNQNDTLYAI